MPIYAMKTAMSEANMTQNDLVEAIQSGGVALQEVLSSQLVAEGQLMRRERTFEGIEVNYETLHQLAPEHAAIADNTKFILKCACQPQVGCKPPDSDRDCKCRYIFEVALGEDRTKAAFQIVIGMIAFASTMGAFLEELGAPGETINADFSTVLMKGLDTVMRYTVKNEFGESEKEQFNLSDISPEGQDLYRSIIERIESVSTGITISPIDIVKQKIEQAGFSVAEVTGRKLEVQFNPESSLTFFRLSNTSNFRFTAFPKIGYY